jgi:site-specific DNA recombinase
VNAAKANIRCAIYTRKSSEEGLDQSFNSLHAQREACEAYVLSQQHEGWQLLATEYDDGGFSGGNMERPGLRRLLEDIAAKRVDTVVVYKVDRLTRALSDFARIVEQFDKQGISFVSITQQFNTTTSMGRLTLNVLLSFAQFEREVTGERIRDKVAASKKKGMWMGGTIPLGYDLGERALIVNETEAVQVLEIFTQYLRLRSVSDLYEHLEKTTIRSKVRTSSSGRTYGGFIISRGTLYHLLSNPLYIGKVAHKGVLHLGQHEAIVDPEIWEQVAALLKANRVNRSKPKNLPSGRLLMGILFDVDGNGFTPSHALKSGRRYSYYTSHTAITRRKSKVIQRIPAIEIEHVVASQVRSWLSSSLELSQSFPTLSIEDLHEVIAKGQQYAKELANPASEKARCILRSLLKRVVLTEAEIRIELNRDALQMELVGSNMSHASCHEHNATEGVHLVAPFTIKKKGHQVRIVISAWNADRLGPVPSLIRAVARSRDWAEQIVAGKARTIDDLVKLSGLNKRYVRRILHCAALSPQMVDAILHGRQPVNLTVLNLVQHLPLNWDEQRFI